MSARTGCTAHFLATGEYCPVCELTSVEIVIFFGRWMWSNSPPVTGAESTHDIKLWDDDVGRRWGWRAPWWGQLGKWRAISEKVQVPGGMDPVWQ